MTVKLKNWKREKKKCRRTEEVCKEADKMANKH